MITATCTTSGCRLFGEALNVIGEPDEVMCGGCQQRTGISDLRPDPPMPAEFPDPPGGE